MNVPSGGQLTNKFGSRQQLVAKVTDFSNMADTRFEPKNN